MMMTMMNMLRHIVVSKIINSCVCIHV